MIAEARFMRFILTPHMLVMETALRAAQQLTAQDGPFASRFACAIDAHHLTWQLTKFSDRYLAEAADTLACRQMRGAFPFATDPPAGVRFATTYWRGLAITMHELYRHPSDTTQLAFRAVYHPEPA